MHHALSSFPCPENYDRNLLMSHQMFVISYFLNIQPAEEVNIRLMNLYSFPILVAAIRFELPSYTVNEQNDNVTLGILLTGNLGISVSAE